MQAWDVDVENMSGYLTEKPNTRPHSVQVSVRFFPSDNLHAHPVRTQTTFEVLDDVPWPSQNPARILHPQTQYRETELPHRQGGIRVFKSSTLPFGQQGIKLR